MNVYESLSVAHVAPDNGDTAKEAIITFGVGDILTDEIVTEVLCGLSILM